MYTKISIGFVALAFAAGLLHARGWRVLREGRVWLATAAGTAGLIPLMVLTLKFGQANVQSVTGVADRVASRSSVDAWVWYAEQWPGQLGWPLLALITSVWVLGLALARKGQRIVRTPELTFWLVWFVTGYLFFSAIDLKEARHSVYILLPMVLAAFVLVSRWPPHFSVLTSLALAACALVWTLTARPVFFVDGYARAAAFIADKAPPNSTVLFSGYRDGSFTFNVRAREDRRDLSVLRADKMLLRVAVRRELGVEQKPLSNEEILTKLNDQAVHYLVVQPGFWQDLEVMRRFEALLQTSQFTEVARISTPANHRAHEKELVVYRNVHALDAAKGTRTIELPIIGRTIDGKVGKP